MTRMTPTIWLWPGQAAYLGPSFHLDAHTTAVDCFAIGVDAPFTLHASECGERHVCSALIPARTRHQIVSGDGRMLFLYLDPGAARGRNLRAAMLDQSPSICFHHRAESAIRGYLRDSQAPDSGPLLERVLGAPEPPVIDGRIRAAMLTIRDQPARNPTAGELAAAAGLSTSRFLHLFSVHAGTSFRRYRVWARMLYVATAVGKGMDLTRAATEAGFASPSHFSDTFHAIFGLTATAVIASGVHIVAADS
ncbi:helix-turn-helix domain-containing protein [Nocardia sp. NBC_01009]|uniref:helix-turn-helix domain-containing protein n=1 Tax=Nocardia sp. NBC_01009 TaxID=2975996 RepID=UPI0038692957|nr:helix-turn-helix domain-containing protein [Nocardia sp. NBC_01009]